jgi:predicted PurR-regulated permease PerM
VARIVSLVVLVVILLLMAGLFFQVMAGFFLPLFLALLLVVIFGPLHRWFRNRSGGHARLAAALTTASILLMVLIPLLTLLIAAGYEAQGIYRAALSSPALADKMGTGPQPAPANAGKSAPAEAPVPIFSADEKPISAVTSLADWATAQLVALGDRLGLALDRKDLEAGIAKGVQQFLAPLALRTTRFLGATILGLAVMVLATYYFFADGPLMVQTILRLSPLEGRRTQELLDQFDSVTRAVVVATLLSAFVQGLLAGLGYYVAGVGSVFLLTALSMLLTLVPFVGAAIVWVPVCLWLYAVQGHTTAALLLAVYCIAVVSTIDSLIKPLVLRGRSNLHPLLALLSVLGGAQALGPIGIFVGPMVVAFLQTLLNMVHAELNSLTNSAAKPTAPEPATSPSPT